MPYMLCFIHSDGEEDFDELAAPIMGVPYLEHLGGSKVYVCLKCRAMLTNKDELVSTRFTGATGRAFLFNRVVNITFSEVQDRLMLTGRHMVRDVACKRCETKLGWIYEYAVDEEQRYKEGRVILERAWIAEVPGLENDPAHHPNRQWQP